MYIFRVPLRSKGVMLSFFFSLFANSGKEGVVRESQAVRNIRHSRIFRFEQLRFFRMLLRADKFGLRNAYNFPITVRFMDYQVFRASVVSVRIVTNHRPSIFGYFLSSKRYFRSWRIRLSRANLFSRQAFVLNSRRLFANVFILNHASECSVQCVMTSSGSTTNVCAYITRIAFRRLNVFRNITYRQIISNDHFFRLQRVVSHVLRLRLLRVQGLIQGRFYRTIQFNGQGLLCAYSVLSNQFNHRHAVHSSVHCAFNPMFFHCPARCFPTTIVIRINVSVKRKGAIQVRRAFRRRIVFSQISTNSPRAMNGDQANYQSATKASQGTRFFTNNPSRILRSRRMAKRPRHLRSIRLRIRPLLSFIIRVVSMTGLYPIMYSLFRMINFRFSTM